MKKNINHHDNDNDNNNSHHNDDNDNNHNTTTITAPNSDRLRHRTVSTATTTTTTSNDTISDISLSSSSPYPFSGKQQQQQYHLYSSSSSSAQKKTTITGTTKKQDKFKMLRNESPMTMMMNNKNDDNNEKDTDYNDDYDYDYNDKKFKKQQQQQIMIQLRQGFRTCYSKLCNNGITNSTKALFPTSSSSSSSSLILYTSIPIWVLVLVASLDNADKQLLASSFGVLETTFGWNVKTLGYVSMYTNLSYALSLPIWGWLVHTYGMSRIHILLSLACIGWGITTCIMAMLMVMNSQTSQQQEQNQQQQDNHDHDHDHLIILFQQAICRAMNGFALGSILPLSQTLLVELVQDPFMRGRAFGFMAVCEKLAGTIAAASIVYYEESWQYPYYSLGFFSMFMGMIAMKQLHPMERNKFVIKIQQQQRQTQQQTLTNDNNSTITNNNNNNNKDTEAMDDTTTLSTSSSSTLTLKEIIQRIVRLPAFLCLVAQGIFGGTPWDIMSFLLLLMEWRGFTKEQIVMIQFTSGLSATFGGWLGGMLGDYAYYYFSTVDDDNNNNNTIASSSSSSSSSRGTKGRIGLAFISVIGGIPLYGLYIYSTNYYWALLWSNMFHIWASWTPTGALRPICADLTKNPSERAQIVSYWIVLEKASGAIFGAPLVGYLTSNMLSSISISNNAEELDNTTIMDATTASLEQKAQALAFNIFALSAFFWTVCAFFWVLMAMTLPQDMSTAMTMSMTTNANVNANANAKGDYSLMVENDEMSFKNTTTTTTKTTSPQAYPGTNNHYKDDGPIKELSHPLV